MKILARQVTRLGLQRLWYDPEKDQYYVSIDNRTYHSKQPIPKEKAPIWFELLGGKQVKSPACR
jgi:hypothetical protein